MMKLIEPSYNFEDTLNHCIAGISGNNLLKQKVTNSNALFKLKEDEYLKLARTGMLHTISPISNRNANPIVINNLTKSELVNIYEQYFVNKSKPARKIYDALLNAAKEKCPFCGGIGTPSNLDHFLPKTHFPQFSVMPRNLVPACRDCNMDGKGHSYATNANDQIIQPYLDNSRFFNDQWIFADYQSINLIDPGVFKYYISAPSHWTVDDKKRVESHFNSFNLAKRYSVQAAEQLGMVLQQINNLTALGLDSLAIKSSLLQPGVVTSPFPNHWKKGMYQALLNAF